MQHTPLVLASGSRARADMLRNAGVAFHQQPALIDEQSLRQSLHAERVSSDDAAVVLAETKARHVARTSTNECIVVGADQLLDLDGEWLEKPADKAAARQQLQKLRGRKHQLVSAVVGLRGGDRIWHKVETADIWMRHVSDAFLDAYLADAGEAACQSVGAYQLEGRGAQLMARIDGDYFCVLGLPLLPLLQFLRDQSVLEV